jgi:hypothetical protein
MNNGMKRDLFTSCLEQEVKSIDEALRNVCAGGIKDVEQWMPDLCFM